MGRSFAARQRLVEQHGGAQTALRQQRVARDFTAALPAHAGVQPFGAVTGGVQHQQGFAAFTRRLFSRGHQCGTQALLAGTPQQQHLAQVGAVGLVFRLVQHQLDGTDHAGVVFGHQQGALALRHVAGNLAPEGEGALERQ